MATFGIYTQYIFLNRLYPTIQHPEFRLYPTILRKIYENPFSYHTQKKFSKFFSNPLGANLDRIFVMHPLGKKKDRLSLTTLRKKYKNLGKVNIFSKLSQLSLGFIRASPSSAKLKPSFPWFYTGEPVICPTKAILPLVLCGRVRHFLYIEIFILRKIFQVFLPSFTCISASESDKSAVYAQIPV